MMLVAGLGAVISLFVRFRRARGDERQQIKWFVSAAALTFFWMLVFPVVLGELLRPGADCPG
jgi:RsiW-degrading membrane proteinase PrsW (M82 family)